MSNAGDGLAMFGAGLADEGLHVDQAGRQNLALAVDHPGPVGRCGGGERRSEIGDPSATDEQAATARWRDRRGGR